MSVAVKDKRRVAGRFVEALEYQDSLRDKLIAIIQNEPFHNISGIARRLFIDQSTVYHWINKGGAVRASTGYLIEREYEDLQERLAKKQIYHLSAKLYQASLTTITYHMPLWGHGNSQAFLGALVGILYFRVIPNFEEWVNKIHYFVYFSRILTKEVMSG
jgi:hypothetical protein